MLYSKIFLTALAFGAILPHTLAVRYESGVINTFLSFQCDGRTNFVVNDDFEICDVDVEVDLKGIAAGLDGLVFNVNYYPGGSFGITRGLVGRHFCGGSGDIHALFDDDASAGPIDCSSNLVNDGSAVQPEQNLKLLV
ncbi:unknown protein [Seminavis robusta]|uniref:Uncharacterized protein n=1 Tax=Seminavis robusta TaxID=568900 RepID=A0A9N8HTJ1_9STRA|nr:unknown protein [Seminavis robusta]|eukprot:Sro1670_g289960.1 n/a (138) ;mRNA; f:8973-9386